VTLAPSKLLGTRLRLIEDEAVVFPDLGTWCACPGCGQWPMPGVHHIEPRSRTGGPRVCVIIDKIVVVNIIKLCKPHHDRITGGIGGHRARIAWHDAPTGHWCWLERGLYSEPEAWYSVGPLSIPQQQEVTCERGVAVA
jgi:hypothetical protein